MGKKHKRNEEIPRDEWKRKQYTKTYEMQWKC